jgi:DNA-directed RNA polymerase specialized sigma24 family protein
MITLAQIRAAQSNDLDGITAVLAEMDERIGRLAAQASRRIAAHGDYREDFAQDAREALFLALPRYEGESVDGFLGFLYVSVQNVLKDKVRKARYQGTDKDAIKVFMSMLEVADGDVNKAEALTQTEPEKGLRLSADRARAARLAFLGSASLDAPAIVHSGPSAGSASQGDYDASYAYADRLVSQEDDPAEVATEVRPKVGRGAALEALAVLQRYSTAYRVLNALPASVSDVEAIEDAVTLPRDPAERRFILDACAILHSYVSTATDGDLTEDLRDVNDERKDERAAKVGMVHAALDRMGTGQRAALVYSFGIGGVQSYGWGDASDMDGLSEALGATYDNAKVQRSKARVAFAKYFIALVAVSEADALSWAAAAAEMRKQAGRK